MHELFWMLQFSVTISAIYCLNPKLRLCFVRNWVLLYINENENAAHSWFDLINSLFFVFPSDIWCKINKLLKYSEYQLTKRCLEGRLEGFKCSSWFLKIMKVAEYRIAKIFIIVVDGRRHHHYSRGYHVRFYFNETVFNSDHLIPIVVWVFAS